MPIGFRNFLTKAVGVFSNNLYLHVFFVMFQEQMRQCAGEAANGNCRLVVNQ